MTQQSHYWAYTPEKTIIQKELYTPSIHSSNVCSWKYRDAT